MSRPDGHRHTAAHHHRSGLAGALLLSAGILVVELAAGIAGNSIALLADAGHVFADVSGMALSTAAIRMADRRPTDGRSFGLYRLEVLAATANALLLIGIAVLVAWEGVTRLVEPEPVSSSLMVGVAAAALVANLGALALLRRGQAESLPLRAAYLEVMGDALGAATVLAAGVVIALTGMRGLDGLAAILIGALIVPRTWHLLRESLDVLLEATPKGIDLTEVRRHVLETPGVRDVHDLHAWTITSGMNVVSAHVVIDDDADAGALIDHLSDCLAGDFDIDHSTFQLETPDHALWEGRARRAQH
jgi:cobalt-zinc-cadmium efflux system protein